MGCNPSKRNQTAVKDTFIPDPLNLNHFAYWYQIFDYLEFSELLIISPVCKIFHDHTGNNKILKKFQKYNYSENSITDCEPMKKDITIEMEQNSEVEPTPSFLSPVEVMKKHFVFSHESRRSSMHNPSDSLDSFVPSNTLRGMFVQGHDPIMEVNVYESAEFKQGISEMIEKVNSESEFESFKVALWQSLQTCDIVKIQKVLRTPRAVEYLKDPMSDWVKGTERLSVLGGAICTMCYVVVKIILEYVQIEDLERGVLEETLEKKTRIIKKITPLQLACARGIFKIVESLLIKGSALHISGVFQNRIGLKETITDLGSPALAICANSKLQKLHMGSANFITKFDPEDRDYCICAQSLLEFSANPDINTLIPMYPTPLFLAINSLKFIKLLLNYRANPNWTNIRGQTPLYVLSEKYDNVDCARALIEGGSLVDPPTCRPLFVAINSKNQRVLELLKENNAAINGNEVVPSALQVAVSGDDIIMCRIVNAWKDLIVDWEFRQNGKNLFHRIAMNQGTDVFDIIVADRNQFELDQIKAALNQSTYANSAIGDTIPLYFALGNLRLAKKFLQYGAEASRINLAKCLKENNLERTAIQLFVEYKVDVKAKWEGKCPVWMANEKGRIDLLVQLLKAGGDPNSENAHGMTVLHDACLKGFDTLVKILLKHGADPKKVCKRGLSALEYTKTYFLKKTSAAQQSIEKMLIKFNM